MSKPPLSNDESGHLDLILATSEIGVWELDVETGSAARNLRHDQIFGHETLLSEWSAEFFLSYVHEDDRERIKTLLEDSISEGTSWSFETRITRADGVDRWISAKGVPKFHTDGSMTRLIGHVIDITETKNAEARLQLLTRELNHRVSNTFTILNAMVRNARKRASSVDEFANTLLDRLAALSRSNRVLVARESERSSLDDILKMELDGFLDWRARITITGRTNIWFSPEASESLALILHELLTNAVKYGALSVECGTVVIDISGKGESGVVIRWTERGGPIVAVQRTSGIGTSVLKTVMRDEGRVTLDFAPEGLTCEITINDSFHKSNVGKAAADFGPQMFGQSGEDRADGLRGRRVLVVEDDPIIGMDIEGVLEAQGAEVIGPFTTAARALEGVSDQIDLALLDVNLGRETSEEVAQSLSALGIPQIVLSGQFDSAELGPAFENAAVVAKPFQEQQLVNAIYAVLSES